MSHYPLFLRLGGVKILLAGAGEVGRRKAADLLLCHPAELLWVDPGFSLAELAQLPEFSGPEFSAPEFPGGLTAWPGLVYEQREVRPEDVKGRHLVFAATCARNVNHMLAATCAETNTLCNVADAPADGTFMVPAHFSHGDILLALCTGGQSPALARRLRRDLEDWFGQKYTPVLTVLGRLRPLVLGYASFVENGASLPGQAGSSAGKAVKKAPSAPAAQRFDSLSSCPAQAAPPACGSASASRMDKQAAKATLIFRSLVNSDLADLLAEGNITQAQRLLLELLPPPLHNCIGDVLYEPF